MNNHNNYYCYHYIIAIIAHAHAQDNSYNKRVHLRNGYIIMFAELFWRGYGYDYHGPRPAACRPRNTHTNTNTTTTTNINIITTTNNTNKQ